MSEDEAEDGEKERTDKFLPNSANSGVLHDLTHIQSEITKVRSVRIFVSP